MLVGAACDACENVTARPPVSPWSERRGGRHRRHLVLLDYHQSPSRAPARIPSSPQSPRTHPAVSSCSAPPRGSSGASTAPRPRQRPRPGPKPPRTAPWTGRAPPWPFLRPASTPSRGTALLTGEGASPSAPRPRWPGARAGATEETRPGACLPARARSERTATFARLRSRAQRSHRMPNGSHQGRRPSTPWRRPPPAR